MWSSKYFLDLLNKRSGLALLIKMALKNVFPIELQSSVITLFAFENNLSIPILPAS